MTNHIPIKTGEEINIMRQGGKILNSILARLADFVKVGMKTEEVDKYARKLIEKNNVSASFLNYKGFPASICTSVNDEVVHGIPGNRILNSGDIVSIDCGIKYKGFHTDSAVTIPVSNVNNDIVFFLKIIKKALNRAIKKVKPGAYIGDISNVIETTVRQAGFSPVRDCVGHGVGRKIHELPEIPNFGTKGTGEKLCPGMTLAIEPIINMGASETYIDSDNKWTVKTKDKSLSGHFEHTVLVTDSSCEILT